MLTQNNVTQAGILFPPDPQALIEARDIVEQMVNKKLPTSSLTLTSVILAVTRHVYANKEAFPTMQVQLAADRIPVLGVGVDFVVELDTPDDVMFILAHEAMHLVRQHLREVDPKLLTDEMFTMVQEAWINQYVMDLTHRQMPTIDGKPTGVDPKKFYDWARKTANEQGITGFPKIGEFYISEDTAWRWVSQLNKQKRPGQNFCNHEGDEGGDPGDPGDPQPGNGNGSDMKPVLDPGALGELVEKALEVTLREAVNENNKAAQEELKKLMQAAEGNEKAQKIFGDMGAYELLGQTTPERKTQLWDRLVAKALASLIKDGDRLTFNRKRPHERVFSPRGKRAEKQIVIAIDTSGSMAYGDALTKIEKLIGKTKAKATWLAWDGAVWPFEPGGELRGGGGTDCRVVDQWINDNMRTYPDAVICVTDGFFQHFTPSKSKRWIWLLTQNGDHWPMTWEPRMKAVILPYDG